MTRRRRERRPRVGLALAGGGPFGAIYEIGALAALEESIEGLDLAALDCYVGVSAGAFLAAALANDIAVAEIHRLFIAGEGAQSAIAPRLFRRPAWREYLRAALERRLPTGLFDNGVIHEYLAQVFTRRGRTNDFRRLGRALYLVATDLDTGESVSFGRPAHDGVPISKAVQASAALPSQSFRSIIHSRMALGISKYRSLYRDSDVLLFEPPRGVSEVFFTRVFSYRGRRAVCEHAYENTRRDLLARAAELAPVLARHGLRLRVEALAAPGAFAVRPRPAQRSGGLNASAAELRDTLGHLKAWMAQRGA